MRIAYVILLIEGLAVAGIDSELVVEGMDAFNNADFEKCTDLLGRALQESLTREEKIAAFRTLALCHSALDHADEARTDFVQLLRLDGQAELDKSVAPKVRALFEQARASIATGSAPKIDESTLPALQPTFQPQKGKEGEPLSVKLSYPGGSAQSVHLFFRARGEPRYQQKTAPIGADGSVALEVPGGAVHAPALELYLTALDAGGAALARAGSFSDPLSVEVLPRPPPKKRTWIWGVVGGIAVAGLAVGLGVGLTVGRPSGNATLTIQAPSQ
jgi:hypothetical protein